MIYKIDVHRLVIAGLQETKRDKTSREFAATWTFSCDVSKIMQTDMLVNFELDIYYILYSPRVGMYSDNLKKATF